MPIYAREPEGKNFNPPPEGIHVACCCDVVDLGMADHGYGEKHFVEVFWQLEDTNPETGDRFTVRRRYTNSLSEKASLRKDLETWRGRKFNKEELAGFDLEVLIGKPCQVQVAHRLTEHGKTFANVTAVIPLGKGQRNPGITNYTRRAEQPAASDDIPF